MEPVKHIIQEDLWLSLRHYTGARIALGRTGVSIPSCKNLECKMAHAFARDAIYTALEKDNLVNGIAALGYRSVLLHSRAVNRQQYLQRPDLGRRLNDASIEKLRIEQSSKKYQVCISIADGLSATAVNNHVLPLLEQLFPFLHTADFAVAPICIVEQGRVAISDETGGCMGAELSLILIGERPGMSSPDSLGAYITYQPGSGNTDAMRNCISNIRAGGLSYVQGAEKIIYLIKESLRLRLSGVKLKDLDRSVGWHADDTD
jgi:ethanolamine ammonia-lyase small subunit